VLLCSVMGDLSPGASRNVRNRIPQDREGHSPKRRHRFDPPASRSPSRGAVHADRPAAPCLSRTAIYLRRRRKSAPRPAAGFAMLAHAIARISPHGPATRYKVSDYCRPQRSVSPVSPSPYHQFGKRRALPSIFSLALVATHRWTHRAPARGLRLRSGFTSRTRRSIHFEPYISAQDYSFGITRFPLEAAAGGWCVAVTSKIFEGAAGRTPKAPGGADSPPTVNGNVIDQNGLARCALRRIAERL